MPKNSRSKPITGREYRGFFVPEQSPLLPLSSLSPDNPLFKDILELERAIMYTGHGVMDSHLDYPREHLTDKEWLAHEAEHSKRALEEIRKLIKSPRNSQGDLYKYWFDVVGKNYFPGNNVLLTAISRACHSLSQWHSAYVREMVLMLLHDAKSKLSLQCFKAFLSFRFIPINPMGENVDYYFDNTPLTLAIVTGLRDVTDKILDLGVLTKDDVNIRTGEGYVIKNLLDEITRRDPMLLSAAHLAALRLSVTKYEVDLKLLTKLRECGANFKLLDEHGRSVTDLAIIEIPQFTPSCILRRSDELSSYAHRLAYDACLADNYRTPDLYDPHDTPVIKSPEIFPNPLPGASTLAKHEIQDALTRVESIDPADETDEHLGFSA